MRKLFIIVAVILAGFSHGQAQTLKITTKTVPLKFQSQRDTLFIPVASAGYPALNNFFAKELFDGRSVKEVTEEYAGCGCSTTSLTYDIDFQKGDILSIRFIYETMGAYPSSYQKRFTLNAKSGKPVTLADVLTPDGIRFINNKYKQTLLRRINEPSLLKDPDYKKARRELMSDLKAMKLGGDYTDLTITKQGIRLSSGGVLPHVIQAFEPDRNLFFPFASIKQYLKPESILTATGFNR